MFRACIFVVVYRDDDDDDDDDEYSPALHTQKLRTKVSMESVNTDALLGRRTSSVVDSFVFLLSPTVLEFNVGASFGEKVTTDAIFNTSCSNAFNRSYLSSFSSSTRSSRLLSDRFSVALPYFQVGSKTWTGRSYPFASTGSSRENVNSCVCVCACVCVCVS